MLPIVLKRWSYSHFCQTAIEATLRQLFPNYHGICWYACLCMAIEAVLGRTEEEVEPRLYKATFDTNEDWAKLIVAWLEERGIDVEPFRRHDKYTFASLDSGNAGGDFIREYPKQFATFLASLLRLRGGLPIQFDISLTEGMDDGVVLYHWINDETAKGSAVILGTHIGYPDGDSSAHTVFVGGFDSDGDGDYIIISDPNQPKPLNINQAQFSEFCHNGAPYGEGTIRLGDMSFLVTAIPPRKTV